MGKRTGRSRLRSRRRRPVDVLAALPSEILDDILSRLPVGDVVRTSALSRAWRRRWESVPDLDIDLAWYNEDEDEEEEDPLNLDDAGVTGVLERCAAPVRRLSLRSVPLHLSARTDAWVHLVSGKSPSSLTIALPCVPPPFKPALPSLFSCDTAALTELDLTNCALPAKPDCFAGFQNLTTLHLAQVFFPAEHGWRHVEAMIAAAPMLEELHLAGLAFLVADGDLAGEWAIEAPNLQRLFLCLRNESAGFWQLGALPKLEYAHLVLNDGPEERDYGKVFTGIASVSELNIGNFHNATQVVQVNLFEGLSCTFQNLRVLTLHTDFYEITTILSTLSLLRHTPFLQVLDIQDFFRDETDNEVDGLVEDFMRTLPKEDLFSKLEYLYMNSIMCSPNDMEFIKYVLRNASMLQLVSVDIFYGSTKSALEASRELEGCEIVSPAARVNFNHED